MKLLFVCTARENRSRTAAEMFGGEYCGLQDLTKELLEWADKVYVFEKKHEQHILQNYYEHYGKVTNLDIPDKYDYDTRELERVLRSRFSNE